MEIEVVPMIVEDFQTLVRWTTSLEFLLQWAGPGFSFPLTVEQLESHHQACTMSPPAREMWKALGGEPRVMVAHAELDGIDRVARKATLSRVIVGDPRARGKGIGSTLVSRLVHRAFEELGLESLDLSVFDFNRRAIDCYQRAGFRIESRMENVRRVGSEYWSLYRMTLGRRPA